MSSARSPFVAGVGQAVLAALSFGITTPLVATFGRGLGPFSTAALLYAGACASSLVLSGGSRSRGAPLTAAQLPRLLAMALAGAVLAPALLAWGLQRSGAATGSLLLNLEAVFTAVLARAVYREHLGARAAWALGLMALGGVALSQGADAALPWNTLGALAIVGATLAWALDNTLSRALAHDDPVRVVVGKAALGASFTLGLALLLREPAPNATGALVLLGCGATGYGLSLRLYLSAQRQMGAARTGSVFALAPFIGVALAWALGGQAITPWALASAALFAAGVALHLTERHQHPHQHDEVEHEHLHRHDDGHHLHAHTPPVVGEHSHHHHHRAMTHEHDHAPDVHHEHRHG